MWKILLLTLIVAGATYAAFLWYSIYSAIQKSAVLIANATPHRQMRANDSFRILIAGDSTGVGVGVGADNSEDSIAGRIGKDIPQATIENVSKSGSKLRDLVSALHDVEQKEYDLIVLQIGANDITAFTSYAEVQSGLETALARADILGKRIIVLTAGNVGNSPVFHWPLSSLITHRTRAVRNIFMEAVTKYPNATYVDLFQERKDDVFLTDVDTYFAVDSFHPSGAAYGVWYSKVHPLLKLQ